MHAHLGLVRLGCLHILICDALHPSEDCCLSFLTKGACSLSLTLKLHLVHSGHRCTDGCGGSWAGALFYASALGAQETLAADGPACERSLLSSIPVCAQPCIIAACAQTEARSAPLEALLRDRSRCSGNRASSCQWCLSKLGVQSPELSG